MSYWFIMGFLLFALIFLVIDLYKTDKQYHRERFGKHLPKE
jgi:hypothetical protein